MKEIIVEHPNGFTGKLYGKSSMVIFKDGKEILHTGFRNKDIQTKEDLFKHLETMPEFYRKFIDMVNELDDGCGSCPEYPEECKMCKIPFYERKKYGKQGKGKQKGTKVQKKTTQ